jgi:hypothetical protein
VCKRRKLMITKLWRIQIIFFNIVCSYSLNLNKILYPAIDIHILLSTSTRYTSIYIVNLLTLGLIFKYENDSEEDLLNCVKVVKL